MKLVVSSLLSVLIVVVTRWGRDSETDPRLQSSVGFKKAKAEELERIFAPINEYLQRGCTTEQGNALYDLYRAATEEDSGKTLFSLADAQAVGHRLNTFLEVFDLGKFEKFSLANAGMIAYPPDISEVYVQDRDMSRSPEKTYTAPQYRDLCTLSTLVRATYPLWYHYMASKIEDTGRFLRIWRLMGDALAAYPGSAALGAYTKVGEYVRAQLVTHERFGQLKDRLMYASVMSVEDVMDHVTATAFFTKLFGFNWLRTETGNSSNPISFIYSSCQQQLNGSGKPQEGVQGKRVTAGEGSEGGGSTVYECFRGRHLFSAAQEAMLKHSLSQYDALYHFHTGKELDRDAFDREVVMVRDRLLGNVHELHIDLLSLFISQYESPLALQLLSAEQIVELQVLCGKVLVETGQTFLGVLMTSYPSTTRTVTSLGGRGQIPKPLVETLKVLYKEQIVDGKIPAVTDLILLLVSAIESKVWVPTTTPELLGLIGATAEQLNAHIIDIPRAVTEFVIFTQGEVR